MPFKVVKKGNKFIVKKNYPGKDGKKTVSKSDSKSAAMKAIATRFANEKSGKS